MLRERQSRLSARPQLRLGLEAAKRAVGSRASLTPRTAMLKAMCAAPRVRRARQRQCMGWTLNVGPRGPTIGCPRAGSCQAMPPPPIWRDCDGGYHDIFDSLGIRLGRPALPALVEFVSRTAVSLGEAGHFQNDRVSE